jgi:tryptophanyl-tRNA synthetase
MRKSLILRCITPWSVSSENQSTSFDYSRVVDQFKSQQILPENRQHFLDRIQKVSKTSSTHSSSSYLTHFLKRGIIFSHRDFDQFLDDYEKGRPPSFLYTGRGPSASSMHIGHLLPFYLCSSLQQTFQIPLVIQVTDDEKFLFRDLKLDKLDKMTTENIKDIIACGFDQDRTFIFRNTQYFGEMYMTVLQIQRCFSTNAVQKTFGFTGTDCVGKLSFAATQAAPCFASAFPKVLRFSQHNNARCLIPCAIDQDPFFVLTRNNCCGPLKKSKPSLLHTTFLPGLKGPGVKMSSSDTDMGNVILLNDDESSVKKKMRAAFSGGRATLKELQEKGADLEVDTAYQYLKYFLKDEEEFEQIGKQYRSGSMSTGAVKDRAAEVVNGVLNDFREKRRNVTDEMVEKFCEKRMLK